MHMLSFLLSFATAGVVGCALVYTDVNVTTALNSGNVVRVCNDNWSSFAVFDKVAVIRGSVLTNSEIKESQAMGLLQMIRSTDAAINATWALKYLACSIDSLPDTLLVTPSGKSVYLAIGCSKQRNLLGKADVTSFAFNRYIGETTRLSSTLDTSLVTALMSLPSMNTLEITIGTGSLLPQLGTLSQLRTILIRHSCLRGTLPASIFSGLTKLTTFSAVRLANVLDVDGLPGVDCGISGTLPNIQLRGKSPRTFTSFDLSGNQLTGQLPAGLLSLATLVSLPNNRFSGSIPGVQVAGGVVADVVAVDINLQGNDLKVTL
jgi:hypothetical protein